MSFLNFPHGENIILTGRIKNIFINNKLSYFEIQKKIISILFEQYKANNIYVPTFNYDFLKKGTYDYINSVSQIGRFSEEFRIIYSNHRSLDPVFSYTSLLSKISENDIWCNDAFGDNSFFGCSNNNFMVINLDLPFFTSSFIHFLEKKFQVPYRYNKLFKGIISHENKSFSFEYNYYVRKTDQSSIYNSKKISNLLKEKKILKNSTLLGVNAEWYFSNDLIDILSKKLTFNKNFLVQ